jgi:hypothetical protein
MTQAEQVSLAFEKCSRWTAKQQHASAMLAKWQKQLAKLQAKGKQQPQPTIDKIPPLAMAANISDKVVAIKPVKGKAKPADKTKK